MPQVFIEIFKSAVLSDFLLVCGVTLVIHKYWMKIKEITPNGLLPLGYTRTRGTRMHIRITDKEIPDATDTTDDVRSSDVEEPAKRERLVDKNAGPVLALMSVPVAKGKPQG